MAQLRIREYKDDTLMKLAAALGFNPDRRKDGTPISPIEEYAAAIDSVIDDLIGPSFIDIVLRDPEVLAKASEYDALLAQKIAQAKDISTGLNEASAEIVIP